GEAIESVLIPEGKRRTLCISSQVGCALGCVFCATGRMGFRRNLTAAESAAHHRLDGGHPSGPGAAGAASRAIPAGRLAARTHPRAAARADADREEIR